jgi:hypothetical protein
VQSTLGYEDKQPDVLTNLATGEKTDYNQGNFKQPITEPLSEPSVEILDSSFNDPGDTSPVISDNIPESAVLLEQSPAQTPPKTLNTVSEIDDNFVGKVNPITLHAIRLGLNPVEAKKNVERFLNILGAAENNGKTFLSVFDWQDVSDKTKRKSQPIPVSQRGSHGEGVAPLASSDKTNITPKNGKVKKPKKRFGQKKEHPIRRSLGYSKYVVGEK